MYGEDVLTRQGKQVGKRQDAATVLQRLAKKISGVADSLQDSGVLLVSDAASVSELGLITNRPTILEEYEPRILRLAKAEYDARRARAKFLDADLLGEPAWDILIDLVIHQIEGKRVSVTSLCIASAVPPTTGLRWIGHLEKEGLLERRDSEADKRRSYLNLSAEGWDKMRSYFLDQMSLSPEL